MLSLPRGAPASSYRAPATEREDTPEPSTSAVPQLKVVPRSFVAPSSSKSSTRAPFINPNSRNKGKGRQDSADDFARHSDDALDDLLHRCQDTIATIGPQALSYPALIRRLERIKHEIAIRVERQKLEQTHLEQPPASLDDTDMTSTTMKEGLRKSQALSQPLKQSTSRMKPMSYEDSLALQTESAAREKEQALKIQHASLAQAKHFATVLDSVETRKNTFSYRVDSDGEEETFDPLEESGLIDFDTDSELDEQDMELLNRFGLAVGEEDDRDR